jgi:hypothetical protein
MPNTIITLTIWERTVLGMIVGSVRAGESTISYLRSANKILDKIYLSEDEKKTSGFAADDNGNASWKTDVPTAIEFSMEEFSFLRGRIQAYDNWPVQSAKACLTLADKFT